ncbi:hypothetical protein PCANC_21137 [Puccinia coronata f. sp. avenae]|uniref:Uncharacterized protein n=1 Tax=Puccinia coronata f. sp. avenae TaxID=200324 RepID=A0A2N5SN97_9BASI|nr:hypothetical protein PCANC_21137 [Puccinia coronata f. sp. avenae]
MSTLINPSPTYQLKPNPQVSANLMKPLREETEGHDYALGFSPPSASGAFWTQAMDAELSNAGSIDVDSETEKASSWRDFHRLACHPDKQLTLEKLDENVDVLRNLRTFLLPSIKHQLAAVLQSLDLSEGPAYPCPNPELTAKNLSELYDTWRNTISAVDNLALDPPLPIHDRRLQDFKRFRISSLQEKIDCSIREKLHDLLCECSSWICAWDSQEDTKDTKFQTRSASTKNRISTLVVNFGVRIDEVIAWSKLSDFLSFTKSAKNQRKNAKKCLKICVQSSMKIPCGERVLVRMNNQIIERREKLTNNQ